MYLGVGARGRRRAKAFRACHRRAVRLTHLLNSSRVPAAACSPGPRPTALALPPAGPAHISAMPPTTTATEPFFRMRLKLPRVAGTLPIHAMKWRQKGMEKTEEAATL